MSHKSGTSQMAGTGPLLRSAWEHNNLTSSYPSYLEYSQSSLGSHWRNTTTLPEHRFNRRRLTSRRCHDRLTSELTRLSSYYLVLYPFWGSTLPRLSLLSRVTHIIYIPPAAICLFKDNNLQPVGQFYSGLGEHPTSTQLSGHPLSCRITVSVHI